MRVPRYDVPRAAPEPLRRVQVFVNSVDCERGHDWLSADWLRSEGLLGAGESLDEEELARARALREALRQIVAGTTPEVALEAPVTLRVDRTGRSSLDPAGTGSQRLLGRLLAIVHDAQRTAVWGRLKTCRTCGWAFYDASRNRSATWCSMSICGNRTKTRAYRRRRAGS